MFSLGAGLYQQYWSPTQINILVIGISGSGKTTAMERLKVTDFSSSATASYSSSVGHHQHNMTETLRSKIFTRNHHHADDYKPHRRRRRQRPAMSHAETRPKSRFAWICPPPPKYIMKSMAVELGADPSTTTKMIQQLSHLSDRHNRSSDIIFLNDEYEEIDLQEGNESLHNDDEDSNLLKSQRAFRRGASSVAAATTTTTVAVNSTKRHTATIPEHGGDGSSTSLNNSNQGNIANNDETEDDAAEEEPLEFDLLPGRTMLPLEKIRPTIGMNLAKLSISKAQVHIWDLGGRLVDLWERYYNDADAVLFVWKLDKNNNDDLERQRSVFQTVRASVDCPILVLGNLMRMQSPPIHCEPDVLYATDTILNDTPTNTLVQFANAKTGEGIKSAMEWLVVRAKQAQQQRKPSS